MEADKVTDDKQRVLLVALFHFGLRKWHGMDGDAVRTYRVLFMAYGGFLQLSYYDSISSNNRNDLVGDCRENNE